MLKKGNNTITIHAPDGKKTEINNLLKEIKKIKGASYNYIIVDALKMYLREIKNTHND